MKTPKDERNINRWKT